jgi:7-cyano-7-deazaguanine reductase
LSTPDLTLLGQGKTVPQTTLETFPNPSPDRGYRVTLKTDEFTCVCPMTGQPDYASLRIEYIPGDRIVESKSLKLYLWSYRNTGIFHEAVTNKILDDFVTACNPLWCRVFADFGVRGGIAIEVNAEMDRRDHVNGK